jgi:GNAT superfamily N-acetyltransferase
MDTFYAVTPSGKGHGLKLLKTALQWAKGQPHVKRVVFNLVAGTPDQKRAEELYKRLGMECVGSTWSLEV